MLPYMVTGVLQMKLRILRWRDYPALSRQALNVSLEEGGRGTNTEKGQNKININMWTSIAITLNINGLNTLIKSKDCQPRFKK